MLSVVETGAADELAQDRRGRDLVGRHRLEKHQEGQMLRFDIGFVFGADLFFALIAYTI
ncbi:MAG: hypothetical protein WCL37_06180 [Chrysiogenales bacterium]